MRYALVLLIVVLCSGCGLKKTVVIQDRKVLCPKVPAKPTCNTKEQPDTLGQYEKYLSDCRSEVLYTRKARGGCDE